MSGAEPDVVGLELDEALRRVAGAGLEAELVDTRPPWPGRGLGRRRVVRVRLLAPGRVELTCAWEDHRPEGRDLSGYRQGRGSPPRARASRDT
ncbi:MAG: hypothetical protein K6U08_07115 [Firmicutes bacterium]|nr:hypothetical protein [Bacillota bacterium]